VRQADEQIFSVGWRIKMRLADTCHLQIGFTNPYIDCN
jgi:hypothetical protein